MHFHFEPCWDSAWTGLAVIVYIHSSVGVSAPAAAVSDDWNWDWDWDWDWLHARRPSSGMRCSVILDDSGAAGGPSSHFSGCWTFHSGWLGFYHHCCSIQYGREYCQSLMRYCVFPSTVYVHPLSAARSVRAGDSLTNPILLHHSITTCTPYTVQYIHTLSSFWHGGVSVIHSHICSIYIVNTVDVPIPWSASDIYTYVCIISIPCPRLQELMP